MESMLLLSIISAIIVATASLQPLDDGVSNSSDPVPIVRFNIKSIFPFFGPVEFDEKDREPLDDAISPVEPPKNESDPSGGILSIHIMEVFSIRDPSQEDISGQPLDDIGQSKNGLLQRMYENILADIGLLDLSGKSLTSKEVYAALKARKEEGRPVTTLILSDSRIHPMDSGTFAIAEDTINTLVMSNSSVNLDALRGLTNLKVLNLSNNALTIFPWYGLMADSLEVLDLSHNRFGEVRPELSMLKNLRELYLSHNQIMFVEESPLNMLPKLEILDLSMNVLLRANFADLTNLNQLNIDWNYLRLMGTHCRLPPQPLTLKLSSNPWRCDCGLLETRDNNEILDLDSLQCVMYRNKYSSCIGCERSFLPFKNGLEVAALTKDSIGHQGCGDISEFYNGLSGEYVKLRDNEPTKLIQDIILSITFFLFLIVCIFVTIKIGSRPKSESKVWISAKKLPKWSLEKLGKPQEVPYIKIEKTSSKS